MKHSTFVLLIAGVLGIMVIPKAPAQSLNFECSDSCSQFQAQGYHPPQPIGNVNMVLIYAVFYSKPDTQYISYMDSRPSWHNDIAEDMQGFLRTASHDLHNINITILTNGTKPFRAADDIQTCPYPSTVYCYISPLFMSSLMDSVDAQYDFGQFDNDGPDGIPNSPDDDGYVDFVSLNVLWPNAIGGIGLNFSGGEWVSSDPSNKPGFGNIRVTGQGDGALQQIVYTKENNLGLPLHEYGHSVGGLPDMDHLGTTSYNHYSLGGFDIMAGGGFKGVASIYNPWFRDELLGWVTPTQVTGNLIAETMTDLITTQKLLKYTPSVPSNALPSQKFYVSYHTGTDPWEQNWPVSKISEPGGTGGILIWHKTDGGAYSQQRRQPIDLEAAHGKFNWTEDANGVYNTGVPNAATGFDSLEIRKISGGREIQGPYFNKDRGSASAFFVPNSGREYAFYTNPNSNYYRNSAAENYAHNVTSGLAIKNMIRTGGTTKIDLYTTNYTITSNATLTKGTWYINGNITVASGVTLTINPGAELKFASGTSLTVNGSLVADSNDPTKRITFTGTTETPGFWNGILINANSNATTLRRCDVQYATESITISYTGNSNQVTVDKCNIRNNSYGVYINGSGYSGATVHPTISNNFITNNDAFGIDLEYYAKPLITGNRIENSSLGSGILANSNSSVTITYNFISGHALNSGVDLAYSCLAELHRNTIRNNGHDGVSMFSNSNVTAYGAGDTKGRNDIRFDNENGISAYQSSPIFGKDVSNEWGNNWISDNAGYQAYQNGAGDLLRAERCYWAGQQSDVFGNVDVSPYLTMVPSPVGWGQSDTYEPSYLQPSKPGTRTELPRAETTHNLLTSVVAAGSNGSPVNWSEDLKAAIDEGLTTGDWSRASELITGLHRELQDAHVPNVDFTLVADYANNPKVISFVRKMLALVLMEKELTENRIATALAKLAAFGQNNVEHKAELLANAGLIHLYRQNDLAAAQNVLAQLQTLAQNGDASAEEHVKLFGRIIENYQRRRSESSTQLEKPIAMPPQTSTSPTTPALAQNYPNPFNPETIIRFYLNERQRVQLVIYDVTGQRVRTLLEGELSAGEQTISWDGRDHNGKTVASGVYFYGLRVGNKIERKKMTLIR